jgi:hypothetical protein
MGQRRWLDRHQRQSHIHAIGGSLVPTHGNAPREGSSHGQGRFGRSIPYRPTQQTSMQTQRNGARAVKNGHSLAAFACVWLGGGTELGRGISEIIP